METRDSRPNPQGQVSQDGSGLWMKVDSSPETQSMTSCQMPQDETKIPPAAHVVITRYHSVMDDEGADDVFIPPQPPPASMAHLLPAEGSTDTIVSNSSVTLSNGAADATEAKTNPCDLDRHRGEKQLMAARNKVAEVIVTTTQTSMESTNTSSLSNDKDPTPPTDQDQISMDSTGCSSGGRRQDNTTRERESNEEPEHILRETGEEEISSNIDENETCYDKDRTKSDVGTMVPTGLSMKGDELGSHGPPELLKCNQNNSDSATNQPQVSETPEELTNDDQVNVDTRSLDYNLTKNDWVRRESSSSETPRLSISEGSEERMTKGEQGDGNRRLTTDIQQGEELLQRLQLLQQRQDVHELENPSTSRQVAQDLTSGDEMEERGLQTSMIDGANTNLTEKNKENENKDSEKARKSLSTMPEQPVNQRIARAEADNSDDDQSDSWVHADSSLIKPYDTKEIPSMSAQDQLSAGEGSMERQIQETGQEKQTLQRTGGILNLVDNPDILEIPFKTNISLEPLPPQVDQGQCSNWQFSEQKMQKEISQEIQRELVLVNQGKIPGGYSKGEVRQLKETKLLFEAFQQDNTEGPTRHRKLPTTVIKGHVYPSVLERTRSLEMFSLKSCPVVRAHSLRLYESATSEREKSPERQRSKSPTGGSRDKTRLSPYPKQDKQPRLYRSMDSISTDGSTTAVDTRNKTKEGNTRQESPILKHNPFFKLRPALALQPEVEKDIREAKEREEELRRQRCTLYGENRQNTPEEEKSRLTKSLVPDVRQQSRGKLERVWPPPSKKDQMKSEQTQEPKIYRAGGQKAPLWQRWESGLINGQPSQEKD